jgi:rRNA maturation endonuclease Nob1
MGILSRVMGGGHPTVRYQCSACREPFEAEGEDRPVCPVCGDHNVNPL